MENIHSPEVNRKVVLVVDDEAIIRTVASDYVGDAGMTAIEASNADQALDILERRNDVCLVVTDIQMPGSMDGLPLAAIIGQRWPDMAIIVTSGQTKLTPAQLPYRATFLPKPYLGDPFIGAIKTAAAAC